MLEIEQTNAAPILSGDDKAKIKEWYGIDIDSDVLSVISCGIVALSERNIRLEWMKSAIYRH